ncbi:MAG: DUF456 domain-containing protein [Candidatus Nanohaloarchaea archaeon]|nr:DUF456 domain-containing protein [Candidatus Nanohaloarchaea archaeon]
MADTVLLLASLLLLIAGVIGSVTPMLPGALFSIAGVLVYWAGTGFAAPGDLFIAFTLLVGGAAVLFDYFSGAISAKAGGASLWTTAVAGVVGLFLFLVTGPVGILVGVAATVFAVELYRTREPRDSLEASLYAAAGMLASAAVQLAVALAILAGFLLALFL